MQATLRTASNAPSQAELAQAMTLRTPQALKPAEVRDDSPETAELEQVVELGYN